ncbi:MAG: extracellular solute-binding protein [Verrucomicrobia bacterium]|nr:extracellular solute-binding protein [Verrucomicrobiota bacterium]
MLRLFSPGVWIVVLLAVVSSILVCLLPEAPRDGMQYWTWVREHAAVASSVAVKWNATHPNLPVRVSTLNPTALNTRLLSGFYSGTPVADLVEIERSSIGQVFAGPSDDIGLVDLTDLMDREHLREKINAPSLSPWTFRGRVYGLPHDVHPVMLGYRADLVEAAGIDVTKIETWDDYFRVMRPLMVDRDGDGRPDSYLLNLAPTSLGIHEVLLLQAGGGLIAPDGSPTLNSEINIRIVAQMAVWCAGPNRMTAEINVAGPSAMRLAAEGYAVGFIWPDWAAGATRTALPNMAGKFKLMPLPAFTRGGRRTSVFGGTMLGLTKVSPHREAAWDFAKKVYLAPETAERLYRTFGIVSPIKSNWSLPCYDEPDPYYCGQHVGRLYLNLAADVPLRVPSPYYLQAGDAFNAAMVTVCRAVDDQGLTDPAAVEPIARRVLDTAQANVQRLMSNNLFLKENRHP